MDYVETVIGVSFQKIMMEIWERETFFEITYTKEISHSDSPEKTRGTLYWEKRGHTNIK